MGQRSLKVIESGTIWMFGYGFLLFPTLTLTLGLGVKVIEDGAVSCTIFQLNNIVTLKSGWGHSRSLKLVSSVLSARLVLYAQLCAHPGVRCAPSNWRGTTEKWGGTVKKFSGASRRTFVPPHFQIASGASADYCMILLLSEWQYQVIMLIAQPRHLIFVTLISILVSPLPHSKPTGLAERQCKGRFPMYRCNDAHQYFHCII